MTQQSTVTTKNFDSLDDLEEWFEDEQESQKEKAEFLKNQNNYVGESGEIRNQLYEDIKQIWNKYAYLPAHILSMRDMLREFHKLKMRNVQIFIFPMDGPQIPRIRFTFRNKTYIWCEDYIVSE